MRGSTESIFEPFWIKVFLRGLWPPASDGFAMGSVGRGPLVGASEIAQILVSAAVLGLAFTIYAGRFDPTRFYWALMTVGVGFVGHELAHKFMAMRFGYWAAYQIWPIGMLLALVSALAGLVFAALGAVRIAGMGITREEEGVISLSGSVFNLALALAFMALGIAVPGAVFLREGAYLNSWIAVWNCLPLMILDGQKVFQWDKRIWALAFGTSVALLLINSY